MSCGIGEHSTWPESKLGQAPFLSLSEMYIVCIDMFMVALVQDSCSFLCSFMLFKDSGHVGKT